MIETAYDEFARDPLFPCPACPENGRTCRRLCPAYRLLVSVDWINMQYNAGILSAEEKKARIRNAHARYSENR